MSIQQRQVLSRILRLAPACALTLLPAIAFAQAGDDLFTGPFEQIANWIKAAGGILLLIGISLLGFRMAKGDGGSLGFAVGLCVGGILIMAAPEVRDALFP